MIEADLLRELIAEVQGLRRDLAERRVDGRLAAVDRRALGALLPVVATAVGARTFAVRELVDHAGLQIPAAIALRAALDAAGGARKVGRLLARGDGVDVAGFRATSCGEDRDGRLWTVRCGDGAV